MATDGSFAPSASITASVASSQAEPKLAATALNPHENRIDFKFQPMLEPTALPLLN